MGDEVGALLADATELHAASEASAQHGQTAAPEATAEVKCHFIAFVEKEGCIYELDGAKLGPINHGRRSEHHTFLKAVAGVIQTQFIAKDPESLRWNMMALVPA